MQERESQWKYKILSIFHELFFWKLNIGLIFKSAVCIFKGIARNFNTPMAGLGKITIAEVEELVEPGQLDPNQIHIPGIMVQRIFQGEKFEKRIEQRTVRKRP